MKGRIKYLVSTSLVAVVILAGAIATACFAENGGNGGDGNDVIGGKGCAGKDETRKWFDTCYGASWRYYTTSSNSVTIEGSSSGSIAGGTIEDCAYQDVNGTRVEIGGYYRLGLEKYYPNIYYQDTTNPAGASAGEQVGIAKNGQLKLLGGYINFVVPSGGIPLEDAQARFATAKQMGVIPDGVNWDGSLGWFCYNSAWGSSSTPTTPPPPGGGGGEGKGEYRSKSTIEIAAQTYDVSYHNQTSDFDGSVTIKLSTDRDNLTVTFWHELFYDRKSGSGNFDDATTWYEVHETVNGDMKSDPIGSGTYVVNGGAEGASSGTLVRKTVQIKDLEKGKARTVCHVIKYTSKTIYFTKDLGGYRTPTGAGDTGESRACVEVTRPEDPVGETYSTTTMPRTEGSTDGTIMYTGEIAEIGWKGIKATTVPTRRYAEYRAVVYLVDVLQDYKNGITTGNRTTVPRNANDPCTYYWNKHKVGSTSYQRGCTVVERLTGSGSEKLNPGATTGSKEFKPQQETIVVPDYVGYKYCNSYGWKFEYWVSYNQNGTDHWFKESKDYWTTYDASCRVIAKKPSLAIWNGSMLSNGGVRTSTSDRYHNTYLGRSKKNSAVDMTYGSWVEYLGVIGRQADGFASGSAFAIGSKSLEDIYPGNSTLTIANNTPNLGYSGISANPTLRTRLDTFLKSRAEVYDGNRNSSGQDSLGLNSNITTSRIIHVKGDLDITDNIILNVGSYTSIYHVPQVVIFVDGNVRVSSKVTQIDAWIVANGNLNTCSNFVEGGYRDGALIDDTQSDAVNRPIDTCNKQLVFNGPVMAGSLTLRRSYGSDPYIYRNNAYKGSSMNNTEHSERYSAGEIFNYRADSYLWAYAQAGRYDSSYTESYSRELAPRY